MKKITILLALLVSVGAFAAESPLTKAAMKAYADFAKAEKKVKVAKIRDEKAKAKASMPAVEKTAKDLEIAHAKLNEAAARLAPFKEVCMNSSDHPIEALKDVCERITAGAPDMTVKFDDEDADEIDDSSDSDVEVTENGAESDAVGDEDWTPDYL